MGRLIDAGAFDEITIQGKSEEFIEGAKYILDLIDAQPTAFILERVLLQLKEVETDVSNLGHYAIYADDAIKIVLKGGV